MTSKHAGGLLLRASVAIMRVAMHLATAALVAMTVLVVLSSVMRYFVGAPFRFTEEFVGLLFAAMAFLVWPLATLRNEHIEASFISSRLPERAQPFLRAISAAAMIAFCIIFGWHAYEFAALSLKLDARSDVADLSLFGWMAVMSLICVLVVIALVARMAGGTDSEDLQDDATGPLRD